MRAKPRDQVVGDARGVQLDPARRATAAGRSPAPSTRARPRRAPRMTFAVPGRVPSSRVQASPVSVARKAEGARQRRGRSARPGRRPRRPRSAGTRPRCPRRQPGSSERVAPAALHRVPVVHRGLLHLVTGDEGDVLLPAGPGPAGGGLVGLPQHLDQPGRAVTKVSTSPASAARAGGPSLRRRGQLLLDDRGPEPVHLGQVPHQVGHRPVRAVLDPGVELPPRRPRRTRAVLR